MTQHSAQVIPGPFEILGLLVKICLFKAKPQDLPSSHLLVGILAFASVATNISIGGINTQFGSSLIVATTYLAAFGAVIWIALRIRRRTGRWAQTTAAVFGTTTVIRVASWPIMVIVMAQLQAGSQPSSWSALAIFCLIALGVWSLAILMMIFREALEVSKLASFFITVTIVLVLPFILLETMYLTNPPLSPANQ